MSNCLDVAVKKALIFHQDDYSLTRLVYKDFGDLTATKKDAANATKIAHGLGIANKDIIYI